MRKNPGVFIHRTAVALLAALALPAAGDTSGGPNPYAPGFGFDLPSEASWGGWARGAAGTLYAEWDVFRDASHGGASDRTAAPDLGSFGTTSAWLGWNAGTFVSGTGNLYSFTVPQIFSIELAGTVSAGPIRVALQVETQGQLLSDDSFALNGAKPATSSQTFRNPAFPSPMGPTDLVQRVYVWELPAAPAGFVFRFSSKEPHVGLSQAAVDVGPSGSGPVVPPEPVTEGDRTVLAKLPAETLDPDLVARLHALQPSWFPAAWPDRDLAFVRKTDRGGQRVTRTLRGGVQALVLDLAAGGSNRVTADIYRPDAAGGAAKLAECALRATQIRRWRRADLASGNARVGTAFYRLDLLAVDYPSGGGRNRLRNRLGACDTDPAAAGLQAGIPDLRDGDYAVFRRGGG
jgi:hypothetical protein